jgi:hypothetical protein
MRSTSTTSSPIRVPITSARRPGARPRVRGSRAAGGSLRPQVPLQRTVCPLLPRSRGSRRDDDGRSRGRARPAGGGRDALPDVQWRRTAAPQRLFRAVGVREAPAIRRQDQMDPTITPKMDGDRSILVLRMPATQVLHLFKDRSLVGDDFCKPAAPVAAACGATGSRTSGSTRLS